MSSVPRPRVLLADDHRIVTEGLKWLLADEFDLVGVAEDGRSMVDMARTLRPDIVVADISMPAMNGIEAMAFLKKDDIPVVILSMHKEVAYARRALEAGAAGYVLKHAAPTELLLALRAALEGSTFVSPAIAGDVFRAMREGASQSRDDAVQLTLRQRDILRLLAEGLSAKEVARRLDISSRTVEFHKYQIMELIGAKSSADLIHYAIKQGLAES